MRKYNADFEMTIVADSGSTSIDWRIIRPGKETEKRVSPGINPVYQDSAEIEEVFRNALASLEEVPGKVLFYGAGIVSGEAAGKVRSALVAVLPGCSVTAGSDLEAAAIALFGRSDGIAAILGTGSNSGLWTGGRIVRSIPAGGFILGDEGSGAWLGRMLLSDYIKGLLPQRLESEFRREYPGLDYPGVVEKVYRGSMPSRFLASFSPFIGRNRDCDYVRELLAEGFRQFFRRNVLRYGRPDLPVAAVGSVASVYADALRDAAAGCNVHLTRIDASAGDGLAAFYEEL